MWRKTATRPLYLNLPKNAVVFWDDEETEIQDLDRMQPLLAMDLDYIGDITHDYIWHDNNPDCRPGLQRRCSHICGTTKRK